MRISCSYSGLLGIALALAGCSREGANGQTSARTPQVGLFAYELEDEFDPFEEEEDDFDQPEEEEEEEEQPVDKPEEQPVDKPEEQPVDKPEEQPVDKPEEQPVDKPEEQPVDKPEEQPVDKPEEQPVDKPEEQPVDKPEEQPMAPDSKSRADASEASPEAENTAAADNAVLADPRCSRLAQDYDGDGLCDTLEATYGTDPKNLDTDGDSLSDGMEVLGYRFQRITAKLPGANPLRKDIYLEIDYMPGSRPCTSAVQDVVEAFAAAPVTNPDRSRGITLHAEIDDKQTITETEQNIPFPRRYRQLKRKYFKLERTPAYHWALFAHQYNGTGSSGVSAAAPASELMVTLGTFRTKGGTRREQAGTLMHELGHNLGLEHGGPRLNGKAVDQTLYKPNYLSVMNYNYQFWGVVIGGKFKLDYAAVSVPALTEASLNEQQGLSDASESNKAALASYTPIICAKQEGNDDEGYYCDYPYDGLGESAAANLDWNRNGDVDALPVSADIDGNGSASDMFTAIEPDWPNLEFDGGGVIGGLVRSVRRTVEDEEELEPVQADAIISCQSAPSRSEFVERVAAESTATCE